MQCLHRCDSQGAASQISRLLECFSVALRPPNSTWPGPCCRAPFGWAAGGLLPAPRPQWQSIQPFLFPEKREFSRTSSFLERPWAPNWCRALSTRYGSPAYRPRVVDAAAPAPSEPEDGREAAHARDAASRRRRGPRTDERDPSATYIYKLSTPRAATTIAGARVD